MNARIPKATPCFCYDHDAEDAAKFYARTFPGSSVGVVPRAPGDRPQVTPSGLECFLRTCGASLAVVHQREGGARCDPTQNSSYIGNSNRNFVATAQ